MEHPKIIFDATKSISVADSLIVGVDGIPLWIVANGLSTAQILHVQKRVDDLTGPAKWANYLPNGPIQLTFSRTRVPLFRPGYYRLLPEGINFGDPIFATLFNNTVSNSRQPIVETNVGLNQ